MEVFSISGSGFGQVPCPVGWQVTPNGNCGAPVQGCPPEMRVNGACRSPSALRLQGALRALGAAVKDSALAAVRPDGFIGPETTAAVNQALTVHIGPGQAAARLRTGKLDQAHVAVDADVLGNVISSEVMRRTGKPPAAVAVVAPRPGVAPPAVEPVPLGLPKSLWWSVALGAVMAGTGVVLAMTD